MADDAAPRTLTRERLSDQAGGDGAGLATVTRLLSDRYSCRAYRPDPAPRATIARILAAAQMTASWCDAQPWQTIVTEGEGTERFRAAMMHRAVSGERSGPAGFIREWFDAPDYRQLLVGMSFGYPDPAHPANGFRTTRAYPAEIVRWADR